MDINWASIDWLSTKWKSNLSDQIKQEFFLAAGVLVLLYRLTTWTLTKYPKKNPDVNSRRTLRAVLNKETVTAIMIVNKKHERIGSHIWQSHWFFYSVLKENTLALFLLIIIIISWCCPWCNGYCRRKWTRRHEFNSWTRLIAFHIVLIPLGKVWIQLFSSSYG